MSILGKSGRVAIAKAIKAQPAHIAWGPGDGAWINPPPEDDQATSITAEIGRRVAAVAFVKANPSGDLETPAGEKFSLSAEPTSVLLFSAQFLFDEAPDAVVRQAGVYVGGEVVAGLPAGLQYFTPDQVQTPGDLLQIQNRKALVRSDDTRTKISIIVKF